MTAKEKITQILNKVDVEINGSRPTDIQVHDERVYDRIIAGGTLAIGESFMDGWWEVDDLAEVINRVRRANVYRELVSFDAWPLLIKGFFGNLQSKARSFQVGEEHYDIGNELYEAMLGDYLIYTSAVWNDAETLEQAQKNKLDLLCQKMKLGPGKRFLDIGCGWGGLMKYASEKYQTSSVGLSVSVEQTEYGRKMCSGHPIEFVISDYRDYTDEEKFDAIVSVEMIEHVGPKNLRAYFVKAHELLKPGGVFVLQVISDIDPKPVPSAWLDKYIFRNGVILSLPLLEKNSRKLFRFEHIENISADYDKTLIEWWQRLDASYPELKAQNPKYDERFYRMWKFYLHSCAGLFRSQQAMDWQIVYSRID